MCVLGFLPMKVLESQPYFSFGRRELCLFQSIFCCNFENDRAVERQTTPARHDNFLLSLPRSHGLSLLVDVVRALCDPFADSLFTTGTNRSLGYCQDGS